MIRFILPLSALLSLNAVAPVSAEDITTSVAVSYADLNLASPAGQATLRARIAGAVRKVCGLAATGDREAIDDMYRCRHEAATTSAARVAMVIDGATRLANKDSSFQVANR